MFSLQLPSIISLLVSVFLTHLISSGREIPSSHQKLMEGRRSLIANGWVSPQRLFYVQVVVNSPMGVSLSCGGAIVEVNVVVTAAHCVYDKQDHDVKVAVGDFTTTGSKIHIAVRHWLIADGFKYDEEGRPLNDLALVILASRVPNFRVLPMCKEYLSYDTLLGFCGTGSTSPMLDPVTLPSVLQEFQLKESLFMNEDLFELMMCPEHNVCTYSVTENASFSLHDDGSPLYAYKCGTTIPECVYGVASYVWIANQENRKGNVFASVPYQWKRISNFFHDSS